MKPQLNPQELMDYLKKEQAAKENLIEVSTEPMRSFWEGELNQINWTIRYLQSCGISAR